MEKMDRIREVQEKYEEDLLKLPNVTGVAIGHKTVRGVKTDTLAITVLVVTKIGKDELAIEDTVPKELDGIPTDVVRTGIIMAQGIPSEEECKVGTGYFEPYPDVEITSSNMNCVKCGSNRVRDRRVDISISNEVLNLKKLPVIFCPDCKSLYAAKETVEKLFNDIKSVTCGCDHIALLGVVDLSEFSNLIQVSLDMLWQGRADELKDND